MSTAELTFGLVHGGGHSSTCWQMLIPELEARGARSIAMDLPAEDPDAVIEDYVAAVVRSLEGVSGRVILVGHSLGGLTIPLVAKERPIDSLVFLCATIPSPAHAHDPILEVDRTMPQVRNALRFRPDGTHTVDPALARDAFYNRCDPQLARWAAGTLLRPQGAVGRRPSPLTEWPDVPAYYILATDDHAINPEWARKQARLRLGIEAIEMDSDHSPFLSCPAELASVLIDISQGRYPAGRGRSASAK